jgi:hypothetical protein
MEKKSSRNYTAGILTINLHSLPQVCAQTIICFNENNVSECVSHRGIEVITDNVP